MPGSTQLFSLVAGLLVGNIFGVYLAQTYELPDLHNAMEYLFSKAQEYEKPPKKSDDDKDK